MASLLRLSCYMTSPFLCAVSLNGTTTLTCPVRAARSMSGYEVTTEPPVGQAIVETFTVVTRHFSATRRLRQSSVPLDGRSQHIQTSTGAAYTKTAGMSEDNLQTTHVAWQAVGKR
jgi:hypothetical protein